MYLFGIYIPISVFVWKEINSADTKHVRYLHLNITHIMSTI